MANTTVDNGTLDSLDRKILILLQEQGRIPNKQLAEEVGLSPPAALERVRKLEERGIIERYVALVDNKKIGMGTVAIVAVSLNLHQKNSIENFHAFIGECKKVLECYHIAGVEDYILKVCTHNIDDYEHFLLNELTGTKGIDRVKTMFVLSTLKRETAIPLDSTGEDNGRSTAANGK